MRYSLICSEGGFTIEVRKLITFESLKFGCCKKIVNDFYKSLERVIVLMSKVGKLIM